MAVRIKEMKTDLVGELMTTDELDNYMFNHGLSLIENPKDKNGKEKKRYSKDDDKLEIIQYDNRNGQVWIEAARDGRLLLISTVKFVNKEKGKSTKGDPFHSFDDYAKFINAMKDTKNYDYWLACSLMTAMGKRVGDTLSFKWSDLFFRNGQIKGELVDFVDEKTGKNVHTELNVYAVESINEYLKLTGIDPMLHYNENVFNRGYKSLYRAFTELIKELDYSYPITIHSFRKYYANTLYQLHPVDADSLTIVQMILGHSDPMITKQYIGYIDEKGSAFNSDLGYYMVKSLKNETPEIDRTPLVTIRTTQFRELLLRAYNSCKDGIAPEDMLNQLYAEVERQKM